MKKPLMIIAGCLMMAGSQIHAARVAGSEPKEWPANPDKHVITITREADDDTGRKMIVAAESAKPESGVWWITKDGEAVMTYRLKTPHAITSNALDYYSAKIAEYRKMTWNTYSEPHSSLTYKAAVAHHDKYTMNDKEYSNVYVVKMEMTFTIAFVYGDGGTTFTKTRTVLLDANGVPQSIEGDKDESFPEWA